MAKAKQRSNVANLAVLGMRYILDSLDLTVGGTTHILPTAAFKSLCRVLAPYDLSGCEMSVAVIGYDDEWEDGWAWRAGDDPHLLEGIAAAINWVGPPHLRVFQYRAELLAVVLPGSTLDQAHAFCVDLQRAVASPQFPADLTTLSIGLSTSAFEPSFRKMVEHAEFNCGFASGSGNSVEFITGFQIVDPQQPGKAMNQR